MLPTNWRPLLRNGGAMAKKKRRAIWSHTEGEKGRTVTVYERSPGEVLYVRAWNPNTERYVRRSLGHRDRIRAKHHALEQAAKLQQGYAEALQSKVTLAKVFAIYEREKTRYKSQRETSEDRRRFVLFSRQFGGNIDPHLLSLAKWEAVERDRLSGVIDGFGNCVPEAQRRKMRKRTVAGDLLWYRSVMCWGTKYRLEMGQYLMREDPTRGFPVPHEQSPRRPVAGKDRYEATRAVTVQVWMRVTWYGVRRNVRSYLQELLDLAYGTGRRISAICSLRKRDLLLEDGSPYGSVRWPAETDKTETEAVVPMSPLVRAAIDRVLVDDVLGERPKDADWLFPAPANPTKPISYQVATRLLLRAEALAGLPKLKGSTWHCYRRGWASSRKRQPTADVEAAGGWVAGSQSLRTCYQLPDPDTMLQVVLNE